MHMADALLSPAVGGAMYVVSGVALGYSVKQMRNNFDEKRIPLMGMMGAAVFAAQMINFSIPGTGSSGHVAGALILACMLGAAPAFIVMASILLIQCLLFADGGLLAFGCNLFNMGFFGCFVGYQYIFKPLAGKEFRPGRTIAAAAIASVASLELGAFCVTLQTLASGVTSLPFGTFAAAMLPIHVAIGLVEGIATGIVLVFVHKNVPHFMETKLDEDRLSLTNLALVFGLAALVIGGGLSLIACGDPDGLEWSIERLTGSTEVENTASSRKTNRRNPPKKTCRSNLPLKKRKKKAASWARPFPVFSDASSAHSSCSESHGLSRNTPSRTAPLLKKPNLEQSA